MADDKHFQSLADPDLDYIAHLGSAHAQDIKQALKEIHRRQQTKEQKVYNQNKKIKETIIIVPDSSAIKNYIDTIGLEDVKYYKDASVFIKKYFV